MAYCPRPCSPSTTDHLSLFTPQKPCQHINQLTGPQPNPSPHSPTKSSPLKLHQVLAFHAGIASEPWWSISTTSKSIQIDLVIAANHASSIYDRHYGSIRAIQYKDLPSFHVIQPDSCIPVWLMLRFEESEYGLNVTGWHWRSRWVERYINWKIQSF